MKKSIEINAMHAIELMQNRGIIISDEDKEYFKLTGVLIIEGVVYWLANIRNPYKTYSVKINKKWFLREIKSNSKPTIRPRNNGKRYEIDFTLILTKNKIFIISNEELRLHSSKLEDEKGKWSKRDTWGIVLNGQNGEFVWEGDNTIKFKLSEFVKFEQNLKQEHNVSEDLISGSEECYIEGRWGLHIHFKKERNKLLVLAAKKKWSKESDGDVRCKICSFSFLDKYGEYGRGHIEAHHIIPISTLKENTKCRIADLIPICANCHRILHWHPTLTIDDLIDYLK